MADNRDTIRASAYHLASNASLYQPVRDNNFTFLVDVSDESPLHSLLRVNENPEDNASYIDNAQEVLKFSVVKFDVPNFSQQAIEVKRSNSKIYFAGLPSFTEGNLIINDFIGADGKSILEAWQRLSYNVLDDTIPSSDKYKANANVYEYLPDGTLIRSWALYGCWVMGLQEESWNNEGGNKKTVTAKLKFDKAIPTLEYNR